MNRYTNSFDDVVTRARDVWHAADIIARRLYGRRGFCCALTTYYDQDGAIQSGSFAVVGKSVLPGASLRREVWIYEVRPASEEPR